MPFVGIFCETAPHDLLQIVRHFRIETSDRRWLLANDLIERIDCILSFEGFAPRDGLIKNASEGKNV